MSPEARTVKVEHLAEPTTTDLEQLEPIYLAGFPPSERDPFEDLVRAVRQGTLTLLVAKEDEPGGEIAGFMLLLPSLPGTTAAYLPYFAIDERRRGQGVGSRLFGFMQDFLAVQGRVDAVVWEVEAQVPGDPEAQPNRRIRFYRRLGGRLVTMIPNYLMPNFEGGILPAHLMWIPIGARQHDPDRAEVIAWVRGIYTVGYPYHLDLCEQIVAELMQCKCKGECVERR